MIFKEELVGERIVLKRHVPDHGLAELIFDVIDSNREHLRNWFPWEKNPQTADDTMFYLIDSEEKLKGSEKSEYGIYLDNNFIGSIDFFNVDEKNRSTEIGYWISSQFTRRGYTTEAVKVLEKYLFEELKMNRIQIKCDSGNIASAGVIQKCAYKLEGTMRQARYSEYFGNFRDMEVYSKLASEFK